MNREYREIAAGLIKSSIHDGQLDLAMLATLTNNWAREQVNKDPNMSVMTANGLVGQRQNDLASRVTVATREVLGIIPKESWQNRGSIFNMLNFSPEPDYMKNLGLAACTREGQQGLGEIDPSKSLRNQGVVCRVRPTQR